MSNQIKQKQAVVNEVKAILGPNFDPSTPAKDQLTKEQVINIKCNIVDGITNGTIVYNKDTSDRSEVSRYVSGMVSNHFRKAKELNGGNAYAPQSTGRGSRDPQLSELNKLLSTFNPGSEEYNQVIAAIASRKEELAVAKATQEKERNKNKELASINTEALPEGLQNLAESLVSDNA